MKNVALLEFGAENFCCFTDPMVITLDKDKPKLTAITGPNGIGKTSIIDIIPFTWFGVTSKGIQAESAINNKVKKNCHTWTKFLIDADYYEVHRYYKYKSHGNTCLIFKNNEKDPYKKGHKEVKEEIENLIMPSKLFMNVLFFGQKVKSFFTDLTDADQKEIFRKILSLEQYFDLHEKTKSALKDFENKRNTIDKELEKNSTLLNFVITGLVEQSRLEREFNEKTSNTRKEVNASIKFINSELEKLRLNYETKYLNSELDSDLDDVKQSITEVNSKINNLNSEIQSSKNNIYSQGQAKINEFKIAVSEKRSIITEEATNRSTILNNLEKELQEIRFKIQGLKKDKSDKEKSIRLNSDKSNSLSSEISKYEKSLSNSNSVSCPTCNQVVGKSKTDEFKEILETLKNTKTEVDGDIRTLHSEIKNIEVEIIEASRSESVQSEKISGEVKLIEAETNRNLKDLQLKLESAITQVNSLIETQINTLVKEKDEEKVYLSNRLIDLSNKQSEINESINKRSKELNEINKLESDLKYKIQSLNDLDTSKFDKTTFNTLISKEILLKENIDKCTDNLKKCMSVIEALEFWKEGFSSKGIPSMLIDEAIPFMNERIREYLGVIDGGRYVVSFDTMQATKSGEFRDKINVNVLDTQTLSDSREKFSGGQTRIVDIATILTLGDLQNNVQNISFNILLFDEIFDSLDDVNIGYVSSIIKKISREKSIFIISHRHIDQLDADEVLSFS